MIRVCQFITSLIVLTASGVMWYNISRPKVCYKKYLGPDWVADYDWRRECGVVVSNHSTMFDVFIHCLQQIS